MLRALAENGGVIQLVALNSFTRPTGTDERADLDDFIRHLDHAVAVAGIDHVGFGSDFDGGGGIAGLEDVTDLPALTLELLQRGWTEAEIRKFWGGNLLRVMEAVEAAAGGD
jgi:microsomal dipeptidase-like Zn-dependent dipeptidase